MEDNKFALDSCSSSPQKRTIALGFSEVKRTICTSILCCSMTILTAICFLDRQYVTDIAVKIVKHRHWTYVDLRVSVTFACLTASVLFAIQSVEVTVSLYFLSFFPSDIRPSAPLRALSRRCAGGEKALSRRINESRPCAAGCGHARHIRRRNATSNAIALEVAPWPALTQKQRAAMQARQGRHSKQQCKRYRANTVTASSKASATRQAARQPQPAPLSHRRNSHLEGPAAPRSRVVHVKRL